MLNPPFCPHQSASERDYFDQDLIESTELPINLFSPIGSNGSALLVTIFYRLVNPKSVRGMRQRNKQDLASNVCGALNNATILTRERGDCIGLRQARAPVPASNSFKFISRWWTTPARHRFWEIYILRAAAENGREEISGWMGEIKNAWSIKTDLPYRIFVRIGLRTWDYIPESFSRCN